MTTDLLLSVSDLFLTMGLPSIDESLDKLLVAMESFPKSAILGDTVGYARVLGLLLALCVGSYECWMMMLGRRAMDVMKLARIIALSMCITSSSWICSELQVPGKALENTTKAMAKAKNKQKRLREVQDSVETAKQIQEIGQDAHWWDKLIYSMENLGSTINKYAQQAAVAAETKVSEWINDVIRFIGELIFQMTYYGILVAQRIFMTILAMFAPIMFALSIVPPWSNAWSQWISKYLSLSLWGFVTYMCLYYIDFILLYNLQEDITAYSKLLQGQVNTWSQIGALGLQGIGSNCMYAMGMLVGAFILRFVPEVASWLIPGGVSSSAGSAAGSVATAGVAGGIYGGIAGGAMVLSGGAAAAGVVGSLGERGLNGPVINSKTEGGKVYEQHASGRVTVRDESAKEAFNRI